MSVRNVVKVLYAPHKVFQEIAQNQRLIGPLLIFVLLIIAGTASQYTASSKFYLQVTTPEGTNQTSPDPWTESASYWISNANVTTNSNDKKFGANSIQFNDLNATEISMKLNATFSINCTGTQGYKNVTFALKWIQPAGTAPSNVTIHLFNQNQNNYFYTNISDEVDAFGNNTWGNVTVPLGPDAVQWSNNSTQASWSYVTGFTMNTAWSETARSNLTVLIERMLFTSPNYKAFTELPGSSVATIALNSTISFALYWMIFSLVLYVAARLSKVKGELKIFLIIVGYSLIAFFVMQLVLTAFYAAIPPLYITFESAQPQSVFDLVVTVPYYATLLFPIWSIIIAAFGMRGVFNMTFRRGMIAAIIGFFPYYLLLLFGA